MFAKSVKSGVWIWLVIITMNGHSSEGVQIENDEGALDCTNDYSDEFCEDLLESESCEEAEHGGCRKSCGFCDDFENVEDPSSNGVVLQFPEEDDMNLDDGLEQPSKCEDKLPDCSKYLAMCCSMKDAMNASCPKTCRFCSETPGPGGGAVPSNPGGSGPVPTGSTNQDPCGSTNPPSVTVDTPGQTTTTTTLAPVTAVTAGTLPPVGG